MLNSSPTGIRFQYTCVWFQVGSFVVRDSSSHSECYALSVKVCKTDNPTGVIHYLIQRTSTGFKLKVRLKWLDNKPCATVWLIQLILPVKIQLNLLNILVIKNLSCKLWASLNNQYFHWSIPENLKIGIWNLVYKLNENILCVPHIKPIFKW